MNSTPAKRGGVEKGGQGPKKTGRYNSGGSQTRAVAPLYFIKRNSGSQPEATFCDKWQAWLDRKIRIRKQAGTRPDRKKTFANSSDLMYNCLRFKWFNCQLIPDSTVLKVGCFEIQMIWDSDDLRLNCCEIQVIQLSIVLRFQLLWDSNDFGFSWFQVQLDWTAICLRFNCFEIPLVWDSDGSNFKIWDSIALRTYLMSDSMDVTVDSIDLRINGLKSQTMKIGSETQKQSFSARLPSKVKLWRSGRFKRTTPFSRGIRTPLTATQHDARKVLLPESQICDPSTDSAPHTSNKNLAEREIPALK